MRSAKLGSNVVWLYSDAEEIEVVYPIVDLALRQRRFFELIIAAPNQDVAKLRGRYPHEKIEVADLRLGKEALSLSAGGALVVLGRRYRDLVKVRAKSLYVDDNFCVSDLVQALPDDGAIASSSRGNLVSRLLPKLLAGGPIQSIDELDRRLNGPRHILCLGNGPSSEDPRLTGVSWDCLFRVNWIWQGRGFLRNPSVVFTGDLDLPRGKPKPIVIVPNEKVGRAVFQSYCLRLQPPRQGYGFADKLLSHSWSLRGKLLPSNGALMIAVASALAPERITISGMDLYSHAEGRYPGDSEAVDGYSRDHSKITDLEFIRDALMGYRGEVDVLSDALKDGLANWPVGN